MKNFLFLIVLLPAVATAFDPAVDSSDPYEREFARRREANGGFYPFDKSRDSAPDSRTEIYSTWSTNSRGEYRQFLVVPDQRGRPDRVTPGLSSGW